MLQLAFSPAELETALAAGRLACPRCAGPLSPWGHARSREVRMRDGVCVIRPRRAYCQGCQCTHVLCPAWTVPRRRDGTEVIGEALALAVTGLGHRRIAHRLGRPEGTVRGWLRAARSRASPLRASGTRWLLALDPDPDPIVATATGLGDAVEAVMLAVRAWSLRFGPDAAGPWQRAVCLTGGLLSGSPPPPR